MQELSATKQQQAGLAARVTDTIKNPVEPRGKAAAAPDAARSVQRDAATLHESDPKIRQAVEAALKEARADEQNVTFVALKLFGTLGIEAAREIYLLLSEGIQEYWTAVNAIRFLTFSLSKPGVRQFDRLVLQTLSAPLLLPRT